MPCPEYKCTTVWFFLTGERVRAGQDVPPPGARAVHQRTSNRYAGALGAATVPAPGMGRGAVCECEDARG